MLKSIQILMLGLSLTFASSLLAQSHSFINAIKAGGAGFDKGSAITTDGLGNTIITGFFQDSVTFGDTTFTSKGLKDIFIAKTDNQGNFVWAISAGGSQEDEGFGVASDAENNIFITGFFFKSATFGDTVLDGAGSYDMFIAKYNAGGHLLWARSGGGKSLDRSYAISIDNYGNPCVTGYFSGTATFGDSTFSTFGNDDIFIVKYDNNGNFMWAKQCGGEYFDQGNGITADTEGNIIVTGKFSGTAIFADTSLTSSRLFNTFIVKYTANGDFLWARKAGGKDDFAYGIASDLQNNIFVTGYFQEDGHFNDSTLTSEGSGDIFIAKYDPAGSIEWVNQGGANDLDMGYCVATDIDGNVSVSGFFIGEATFNDTIITSAGKDIFVAQYDTDGNLLQVSQAGNSGAANEGHGITMDSNGSIFVTGLFEGTSYFADFELTSYGNDDIFVAKLGEDNINGISDQYNQIHRFNLKQNYPNPFNPTTTIEYHITQASVVVLKVYNSNGQLIETLVNEFKSAGTYQVTWDAKQFSSGIYYYVLNAGNFKDVRKSILIK